MKVLLAIDGSEFSEAAIQTVVTRIRPQGAHVLLVHAIEPAAFFEQDAGSRQRSAQAERLLSGRAQTIQSAGFDRVDMQVVEGDARTGILDVIAQWHPDLVVLGSHGRKGLGRLLLGSVAESVARHSTCSVLIVRRGSPIPEMAAHPDPAPVKM